MKTDQEYKNLEAEHDSLKAQLVAMTLEHDMRRMAEKRNSELIQERDVLSARMTEMREALQWMPMRAVTAWRYMRRLNYSRKLAWAMAAR